MPFGLFFEYIGYGYELWSVAVCVHLLIFVDGCVGLIVLYDVDDEGGDLFGFFEEGVEGDVEVVLGEGF